MRHVNEQNIRHAGIIFVPATMLQNEKQTLAAIMAGYLQGVDLRQMRGIIVYLAHDGLHLKSRRRDDLVYSIAAIQRDIDEFLRDEGG